ncbi:MAG: helix-turn-helix transcriptional regulator [Bacteroidetes bacterium]|nr:helix-turn-helix transcriptional regulator [Bacteroidota bacterium]
MDTITLNKTIVPRLQAERLSEVAHILRAVSHPIRLGILDLLEQTDELTVTEMYEALKVEQSLLSHHLSKLRDNRIVRARRSGTQVFYSLVEKHITRIIDCINHCDNL